MFARSCVCVRRGCPISTSLSASSLSWSFATILRRRLLRRYLRTECSYRKDHSSCFFTFYYFIQFLPQVPSDFPFWIWLCPFVSILSNGGDFVVGGSKSRYYGVYVLINELYLPLLLLFLRLVLNFAFWPTTVCLSSADRNVSSTLVLMRFVQATLLCHLKSLMMIDAKNGLE